MVAALAESKPSVFWLDTPEAPEPLPPLEGERRCELENGPSRWPEEIDRVLELGRENFAAIRETLERGGSDAAWSDSGIIEVATREHEARADERGGRRGPWLQVLDRIGTGFDS